MTDHELLNAIYADLQDVKTRVVKIETTLENETNKNIMIIAENHIDLANKLASCVQYSVEIKQTLNMLQLNINKHEAEIRNLKLVK